MMKIRNILNVVSRKFGKNKQSTKDDLENISHLLRKNRSYHDMFLSFYKKGYSYKEVEELFIKVRDYRPLLRNHNIDILKYDTYSALNNVVDKAIKKNEDEKFVVSLFSNKSVELKSKRVELKIIELKNKGYTQDELRMLLFRRISHYRTEQEFWNDIKNLTIKNDFKFRIHIISFFLGIRRKKIGNFLILDFNQNFWKFAFFVSLRWCIKTKSKFYEYVRGERRQLIIFDFSKKMSDPLYKVGITIEKNGVISNAHNKINDALYDSELATYQRLIIFQYLKNGKISYDDLSVKTLIDIGEHSIAIERLSRASDSGYNSPGELEMFFNRTNIDIRIKNFNMLNAFLNSSRCIRFSTWLEKEMYLNKFCDFDWKDLTGNFHTKNFLSKLFYSGRLNMMLSAYKKEIGESDFTFFNLDSRSSLLLYDYIKHTLLNNKYLYNVTKYMNYDDLKRSVFFSKNSSVIRRYHEVYNQLETKTDSHTKDYRVIMSSIFLDNPVLVIPYLSNEIIDESMYVFCAKYQKGSIYYEDVDNVIKYYDTNKLSRLLQLLKEIPFKDGNYKSNKMKQSVIDWVSKVIEDSQKPILNKEFISDDVESVTMSANDFRKGLESKHDKKKTNSKPSSMSKYGSSGSRNRNVPRFRLD